MKRTGRSALLVGYSVALIILSSVLVILRLVSRRLSAAKFWWEYVWGAFTLAISVSQDSEAPPNDALIIICLLGSYPFYVGVILMVRNGMGRHLDTVSLTQLEFLLKMIYAGNFPYLVIISMTKTSILLFYYRLFGTPRARPGFRKLLHTTQALVLVWFIASVVPGIFRCHPLDDVWKPFVVSAPDVRRYCINNDVYYLSTSTFNIALDFWILVLPLSIVWSLQLSGRRKIGLSAIFLLGGFTCGASIARAYTVANVSLSDFSYDATPSIIWSVVEISVGIICACLPTIQPILLLFSRKVADSTPARRSRRESSGFWNPESTTRRSHHPSKHGRDGTHMALGEELATLRPAYSRLGSERSGVHSGAEAIDDSKTKAVVTTPSRGPTSDNW